MGETEIKSISQVRRLIAQNPTEIMYCINKLREQNSTLKAQLKNQESWLESQLTAAEKVVDLLAGRKDYTFAECAVAEELVSAAETYRTKYPKDPRKDDETEVD